MYKTVGVKDVAVCVRFRRQMIQQCLKRKGESAKSEKTKAMCKEEMKIKIAYDKMILNPVYLTNNAFLAELDSLESD